MPYASCLHATYYYTMGRKHKIGRILGCSEDYDINDFDPDYDETGD